VASVIKPAATIAAAAAAALGAALCCVGPLLYAAIGVGGAWASTFTPLRPYFLGAAALLFVLALFSAYGPPARECGEGKLCATPRVRRNLRLWLWAALLFGVATTSFPWWSRIFV
jgi:mercuric ion transport protein